MHTTTNFKSSVFSDSHFWFWFISFFFKSLVLIFSSHWYWVLQLILILTWLDAWPVFWHLLILKKHRNIFFFQALNQKHPTTSCKNRILASSLQKFWCTSWKVWSRVCWESCSRALSCCDSLVAQDASFIWQIHVAPYSFLKSYYNSENSLSFNDF